MALRLLADRRRQPRGRPNRPIVVRIVLRRRVERGVLEDINELGAFVTTDLELNRGSQVTLVFDIPGQARARLAAVVARRRGRVPQARGILPPGLGLKFLAHTQRDLDWIRRTVRGALALDHSTEPAPPATKWASTRVLRLR